VTGTEPPSHTRGTAVLYLLEPYASVKWNDLPAGTTLDLARTHNADLGVLDWDAAELPFTDDLLRLALIHGQPCSRGLVVDGGLVSTLRWGDHIRETHANLEHAQAAISRSNHEFMESLIPGWTAHGEQLDQQIAEQSATSAQEADEKSAELLAADPSAHLTEHWQTLGGKPLRDD